MSNRLARAKSPYLLQHKDNPVDWYPWGDEAFSRAREEDKPVFLSIGYSTCHWCHVMAHESFEDEEVARLLNEHFVAIKVDREERPDIDGIYMRVCQMMSGQGGWPLTIFMTPDKKPFHATTYMPKHGRFGRMGLMEMLPKINAAWQEQRDKVMESADSVTTSLQEAGPPEESGSELTERTLQEAYQQLRKRYDRARGGFGSGPKFPTPHHLLFLLRYWKRTGQDEAQHMVTHTLDQMRLGGMYDHIGFGFHRYATDEAWLLPHFEKMLYDQALLTVAYLEGYQATGKKAYAETAREIITYVLRDMTSPEGGFYSAEDADSEGEEGKFYVWSTDEVREVLDEDTAEFFLQAYNFEEEGNFVEESSREKTGDNIPHLSRPISELAAEQGMEAGQLERILAKARRKLFTHREKRVRPGRDDKVLTDWNGLMIAALARAGRVLGEESYLQAARQAAGFLQGNLRREEDGRLLHRYREGDAGILAHLDDYAALAWGLMELYEATFDAAYLEEALRLHEELAEHFWDEEKGGFFFTPDDGEALITRQKEFFDGAQPSGNALALLALLRLSRLTGRAELEERAAALARAAAPQAGKMPGGHTALLLGVDFGLGPAREVVIVGTPGAEDTKALLEALNAQYLPGAVALFRPGGEEEPLIARLAPFVREQKPLDGRAAAYVCQDFQCNRPTSEASEMVAQLKGEG